MNFFLLYAFIGIAQAGQSETFKNAINAAAMGQAASDAKRAAAEASDARFSLEQWQAAQTAIMEINAKRAEADQALNRRYTFWGIMVNAFSVAFLALLAKIGSKFRGELKSLPEVIHQLSLIGPAMDRVREDVHLLEKHTNSMKDALVLAEKFKSHSEGKDEGTAEAEAKAQAQAKKEQENE